MPTRRELLGLTTGAVSAAGLAAILPAFRYSTLDAREICWAAHNLILSELKGVHLAYRPGIGTKMYLGYTVRGINRDVDVNRLCGADMDISSAELRLPLRDFTERFLYSAAEIIATNIRHEAANSIVHVMDLELPSNAEMAYRTTYGGLSLRFLRCVNGLDDTGPVYTRLEVLCGFEQLSDVETLKGDRNKS